MTTARLSHHDTLLAQGWHDFDGWKKRYTMRLGDAELIVLRLWPKGWGWRVEAPGPWPGVRGFMTDDDAPEPNRLRAAAKAVEIANARVSALTPPVRS